MTGIEAGGAGVGRHPEVGQLLDYVRGTLAPHEARKVRDHAHACRDCGDQLAALILLYENRMDDPETVRRPATITNFPGVRRPSARPRWIAAAAALVGVLALVSWAGSGWLSAGDGELQPAVPVAVVTTQDFELVQANIDFYLDTIFPIEQGIAGGPAGRFELVRDGMMAIRQQDLTQAAVFLESFGDRWDIDGTALLGIVLFLQRDPGAYGALEGFVADAPPNVRYRPADSLQGLALYFLARLRLDMGNVDGARELIAGIDPDVQLGEIANGWLASRND